MAESDVFNDPRFGKSAGNRYLCQLGNLRNPELLKGDALGRGLLNDENGQLNPFKLEELFHRSLIRAFQSIENWEDMAYVAKEEAMGDALEAACRIVGIPPIRVESAMTSGIGNPAEYRPGSWCISFGRPAFMNPQERRAEYRQATTLIAGLGGSDEERTARKQNVDRFFSGTTLSRADVISVVCHEAQHALQEFISFCLWVGDGLSGDLQLPHPGGKLVPPQYGITVNGTTHLARPEVWRVATQHPTQHPYARAIAESTEQDQGYEALLNAPNVDPATKQRLKGQRYSPRTAQMTRENNATWLQYVVERDVNDTAWFQQISQEMRPPPAQPRSQWHQKQPAYDVQTWVPSGCLAKPVAR